MDRKQELQELERQKKELEKRIKELKEKSIDRGNVRISKRLDKYTVSISLDMGQGKERHMAVVRYISKDELLKWTHETISNLESAIKEV